LLKDIIEAIADIRVPTKDLSGGIKHYNHYPGPVARHILEITLINEM
jgi:hypothetical protein